ncbi:MAG: hypothetical protein K0R65_2757 [Crocinitomicaceae bacterium]|jgi:type II secretory pathway pseudopilin PulG|nr:hypothetical protein [Crocinitomicaceae bacterium]
MLLKRKIKASSIAEIVVALAVIAICFAVASLVFIRSTGTTSKFMDVKKQTELQSEILEKLYRDQLGEVENTEIEVELEKLPSEENDSLTVLRFLGQDERLIWSQESWNVHERQ